MALLLGRAGRAPERSCRAPLPGRLRDYPTVWDRPRDIRYRLPRTRRSITGRRCRSTRWTGIETASQIPRIYTVRGNRDASRRLREQIDPDVPICPLGAAEAL